MESYNFQLKDLTKEALEGARGQDEFGKKMDAAKGVLDEVKTAMVGAGLSTKELSANASEAGGILDGLASSSRDAAGGVDDLGTAGDKTAKIISTKMNPAFQKFYASMLDNPPEIFIKTMTKWRGSLVDAIPQVTTLGGRVTETEKEQRKAERTTADLTSSTEDYSQVLEQASNLTIIFGQNIGRAFGGAASAIGGFSSLFGKEGGGFSFGGFLDEFKKKTESGEMATSFGSIFSGLASSLPAIGAIAGPAIQGVQALIGVFQKPEYEKVFEDVGRDWGVNLSEGLSRQIADLSDQIGDRATAVQLSLGGVFGEAIATGSANFDLMAEKAADTFSFLERGQITSTQAQQCRRAIRSHL
jgi:hypothetical protein